MGTTANRLYPYPDPTDPADFPQGMQDLAEAVDLDIQALVNSLTGVPFCVVSNNAPQAVPFVAVEQALSFATVDYDNDNMADLATTDTRITPPTAGLYFLHGSARVSDSSTRFEMFLRVGASFLDFARVIHQGNAPAQPRLAVSALASLSGTDEVLLTLEQNTGAPLFVNTARLVALRVA